MLHLMVATLPVCEEPWRALSHDGRLAALRAPLGTIVAIQIKSSPTAAWATVLLNLLDSVAVAKRVEGVLRIRQVRRDRNDHDGRLYKHKHDDPP